MPYQETLLYGHHELGEVAKKEARLAKERKERFMQKLRNEESGFHKTCARWIDRWKKISETTVGQTVEDFVFLTTLAMSVSVFSFSIDLVINRLTTGRSYLLHLLRFSVVSQFFGWVGFGVILTWFSVGITRLIAPTAIGSGIPEVKTMIRGVVLKEYLTLKTLVAKVIGLMASLGSGLPVGKEGPFVHIAAASAAVIAGKLPSFSSGFQNCEKRMADILAPASAVGVACTFASTVGGLLFSIESTATYFALRNYWRSFYAAAVGTIFFRCLNTWINEEETLHTLEKTYLRQEVPFATHEMFAFALLGIASGVTGVLFIAIHKHTVLTIRSQKTILRLLKMNRFIYPTIIACTVGAVMFPPGFGNYHAGEISNSKALEQLFTNFTFVGRDPQDFTEQRLLRQWGGPRNNVVLTCTLFFVMRLAICAISTTLPFPCGMFVPALAIGAGLGRMFGETMAQLFPDGLSGHLIVPGGYALVGSAAVAGAVTHTFSPVVIIFELTGQLGHILPCLVAVMIANMISRLLTPSVYDVIINIKKLPYLPAKISTEQETQSHWFLAEDIMVRDIKFLTCNSTYQEASALLSGYHFKSFPIVNSVDDMLLLGTIHRRDLHRAIDDILCLENKLKYFSHKLGTSASLEPTGSNSSQLSCQQDEYNIISEKGRKFSVSRVDLNRKMSTNSTGSAIIAQFASQQHRKMSTLLPQSRRMSTTTTSSSKPQISEILAACTEEERKKFRVYFKSSESLYAHDPEQEIEWRDHELRKTINFDTYQVDVAPFQIVDKMSLYQVHSLFSLLSLHDTLVTRTGSLVGVISLREVRAAIQGEINYKSQSSTARQRLKSCFRCMDSTDPSPVVHQLIEMSPMEKDPADNESLDRKSK